MLSVVIVTKNRASDLKKCLDSLAIQTSNPSELVIIDNNSTDGTTQIVKSFAQAVSYPVKIIRETKQGYPVIYNRGLKEATHDWITFIDDDCVASASWISAIQSSIRKYPHAAAILGLSETLFTHNPYAFSTYVLNYLWKENGANGEKIFSGEILDNKNIVYNRRFLDAHKLRFDEKRISYLQGASEDCELGDRIMTSGGQCYYRKSIRVKHKDPTNLSHFTGKFIRSYKGYLSYQSASNHHQYQKGDRVRLRNILQSRMSRYNLTNWEKLSVYTVLLGILCIKGLFLLKWDKVIPWPRIFRVLLKNN